MDRLTIDLDRVLRPRGFGRVGRSRTWLRQASGIGHVMSIGFRWSYGVEYGVTCPTTAWIVTGHQAKLHDLGYGVLHGDLSVVRIKDPERHVWTDTDLDTVGRAVQWMSSLPSRLAVIDLIETQVVPLGAQAVGLFPMMGGPRLAATAMRLAEVADGAARAMWPAGFAEETRELVRAEIRAQLAAGGQQPRTWAHALTTVAQEVGLAVGYSVDDLPDPLSVNDRRKSDRRTSFIEAILLHGYEQSKRSPRTYHHADLPSVRWVVTELGARREVRSGDGWSLDRSYRLASELNDAVERAVHDLND